MKRTTYTKESMYSVYITYISITLWGKAISINI